MGKKIRFYTSEKEAKKAAKDLKYKVFTCKQIIGMIMDIELYLFSKK